MKLKENDNKYRKLVNRAPIGIFKTTLAGKPLSINPTMAKILGCRNEKEALQNYKDLKKDLYIDPEQRKEFIRKIKKNGKVKNFEYRAKKINGSIIWLSMNAGINKNEDGIVIIDGFTSNITERKTAEENLKKNKKLLKKSQKIANIGSWTFDLKTNTLSWTDEVYRIFGLNPQQFEVTYKSFLKRIHPEDREKVDKTYNTSIKNNKKGYEIQHRIIKADSNEIRYIHEKCEHTRNNKGEIISSEGMVQDITEIRKLENYIINLEKLNTASRLSYNISHEFNNILAVIMATAQLSLKKIKREKIDIIKLKDKFNTIVSECKKGKKISSNLTNMVKPSKLHKEKILIQKIIDKVIQIQKNELTLERISVVKEYNTNKKVLIDSSQMEEVFLNLIINARHAIKPKGSGKVMISVNEDNEFIKIIIKDNGIGISKETQTQIFEPFFTTKGDYGKGSGLGLSIVLRIIENHNGKIHLKSKLGEGAKFIIKLPVVL
ncbi:MAG: PAS domain-containing sensor histidine kinase [Bacillota bacterium]